ncbi:MAG: hypothetical protein PHI26_07230 [Atopobiaceae bacterium]|nr:hypothetical protein [Atopobiaceae bacterium]
MRSHVETHTRILAILLVAVLALVPVLATTGCRSQKDEEADISSQVDASLDALGTADEATIEDMLGDDLVSELQGYGVSASDLYHALLKHFSYTDDGVTVDGDTATVTLTSTNVDFDSVATAWNEEVTAYASSDEGAQVYTNGGQSGFMKVCLQKLMDRLNADDAPLKTSDATVTLTRGSDGTWNVSDQSALEGVLLGGSSISSISGDAS